MDFVPSAGRKTEAVKRPTTGKTVVRQATVVRKVTTESQIVRELPTPKQNEVRGVRRSVTEVPKPTHNDRAESRGFSIKDEPALGVIEDLNPKFVSKDVPKRPLHNVGEVSAKTAKAQRVGAKSKGSVVAPVKEEKRVIFAVPKSPFINQEKIVKRPLSKNAYAPRVPEAKPEKSGPVTIISKPEKDAHVSLIVTIIITIILGAAAGTVAFLLLPK